MKKYSEAKKYNFSELKGISQKTMDEHYGKLYSGYVKKWQEIQDRLKATDKTTANATFSDLREAKLEEGFAANAVLLHEAYFDILGGDGVPGGEILQKICDDFGSFEQWRDEFKALGLTARGWVILAFDFNDGKLRNYIADVHNQGGIWGVSPVLVMDVYEHAYFIDFGADRKSYIEAFFQNVKWEIVNKKFEKY
ncbi:MAG: Fe-Mn family superoxide dismutase [Candidatus Shapirobacteria bacterium]|jgi:Fe-Mn family superoxide dismutase